MLPTSTTPLHTTREADQCLGRQKPSRQMGHSCSSIALSLEEFKTIDVPFDWSSTVRQRQACYDSRLIVFQSVGKLPEFSDSRSLDALQP